LIIFLSMLMISFISFHFLSSLAEKDTRWCAKMARDARSARERGCECESSRAAIDAILRGARYAAARCLMMLLIIAARC
jgi:hypothetical protein